MILIGVGGFIIEHYFKKLKLEKKTMKGAFLRFKFIGDAAYPIRRWFYSPFKGEKDALPREKAFWNFIQSCTRMAIEKAFGILKVDGIFY